MVLRSRTFPRFLRRESSIKSQSTLESTESTGKISKKKPQQRRTRVRFEFDENDQVKAQMCVYDAVREDEIDLCFTPKPQMKQQKKNALEEATDYAQRNAHYVQCLEMLFSTPLKCSSSSENVDQKYEALCIIGECEARGLESRMSPLIVRHKQWAMNSILRRQEQLKKEGLSNTSAADVLRVCCEHVNKGTRDLALKYAMADEMEAQKIYVEIVST